jgi:hypothetical protein
MTIGMARGLTLAELSEEECTNASTAPIENARRLGNHATQTRRASPSLSFLGHLGPRWPPSVQWRVGFGPHPASEAGRPAGVPSPGDNDQPWNSPPAAAAAPPRGRESGQDRCGERYLRERKAWTELAQINRELKLLRSQLAALEERRAALIAYLAEQGDHQA